MLEVTFVLQQQCELGAETQWLGLAAWKARDGHFGGAVSTDA